MVDKNIYELMAEIGYEKLKNVEVSEIGEIMTRLKKLKEVEKKYNEKFKQRKDGRYYIRLGERQVYGKTKEELLEKLFEVEYGRENSSMETLYEEWKQYKLNVEGRSTKTIKGFDSVWKNYLKNSDIAKTPLRELKSKDFKVFFGKTIIKHNLTQKYFSEIKGVVNGILDYAVEEEIIPYNFVRNLNTNTFAFKIVDEEEKTEEVYSVEDRTKLLKHLDKKNDLYSLAMSLDFHTIMRIGELLALKWSDFGEDSFRIQRQLVRDVDFESESKHKYKWVLKPYVKGRKKNGFRNMPLTSDAKKILARIKEANPNSEYLFIDENGEILYQDTFNEKLKEVCKEIGIEYFSSHKIRFCVASYLYIEGVSVHILQKLLGHTTLKMTLHYLRNVKKDEQILEKMENILCLT